MATEQGGWTNDGEEQERAPMTVADLRQVVDEAMTKLYQAEPTDDIKDATDAAAVGLMAMHERVTRLEDVVDGLLEDGSTLNLNKDGEG